MCLINCISDASKNETITINNIITLTTITNGLLLVITTIKQQNLLHPHILGRCSKRYVNNNKDNAYFKSTTV